MIETWVHGFFSAVDAVPQWQLLLLVGVALLLETSVLVGLVTPGETVLVLAATTVGGPGEFAALAAVATAGSIAGQTGGYLIGRRWGGALRRSRAGRWIGETQWSAAEAVLHSGKGRVLVGSRFLAVAHSLVPVLAGTLRMPMDRFVRYTVLGAAVWSLTYVGLGSAASVALRSSAQYLGPAATVLAVVAVVVVVVVRKVRARAAERRHVSVD